VHLVRIIANHSLAAKIAAKTAVKIVAKWIASKIAEQIAAPKRKVVLGKVVVRKKKDVSIALKKAVSAQNLIVASQDAPNQIVAANKIVVITMREEIKKQIHHQVRTTSNLKYVFRPVRSESVIVSHYYLMSLPIDNHLQHQQRLF
jgi:hypothetical protein